MQFIRYASLVKTRGARVLVECPDKLAPLFASCAGIDQVLVEGTELPTFDVHMPLLSLPGIFKITQKPSVPVTGPPVDDVSLVDTVKSSDQAMTLSATPVAGPYSAA